MGKIHSIESFGTVDGPGIRYVVFFQGCPMRCLYCHNPDTWNMEGGREVSVDEILAGYEKNKNFYHNGGITATGGEPLMQLSFLTQLFERCRERNIHTCLDTSGITYTEEKREEYVRLLKSVDLVLLDIKHEEEEAHKQLTARSGKHVWKFLSLLDEMNIPVRIRHVIVPGYTMKKKALYRLGKRLREYGNIKELEVLPYHQLGVAKYEQLSIDYPLKEVREPSKEETKLSRNIILKGFLGKEL